MAGNSNPGHISIFYDRPLHHKIRPGREPERIGEDEAEHPDDLKKFHQIKARIELVGEIEDVKTIGDLLKELARN